MKKLLLIGILVGFSVTIPSHANNTSTTKKSLIKTITESEVVKKATDSVKKLVKDYWSDLSVQSFVKDVALAYLILMGTTTVHELGHAAAVKALYGVSSDTYIGMSKPIYPPPIQPGKSSLSFVGLYPMGEYFPQWNDSIIRTPFKNILFLLAGPIVGALANYLVLKVLLKKTKAHEYPLSKLMSFSGIIGHAAQLIPYQGLPVYNTPSDGARIAEAAEGKFFEDKPS
jgi:Zn-dependent protease